MKSHHVEKQTTVKMHSWSQKWRSLLLLLLLIDVLFIVWRLASLTIGNTLSCYPTKITHGIVFRWAKLSQSIITVWVHTCWLKSYNLINRGHRANYKSYEYLLVIIFINLVSNIEWTPKHLRLMIWRYYKVGFLYSSMDVNNQCSMKLIFASYEFYKKV